MKRLYHSFGFAMQGILTCFKQEPNFRIHVAAATAAIGAGFCFSVSNIEWIVITACIALVLSAELMNTAIERLCDLVTTEKHPLIKLVKDVAAAAVLVLSIASAVCAIVIFIPRIYNLINNF